VLGRVNSESLDTKIDQIVDVVSNLAPDVILATVKIIQTNEVAVADLSRVLVVADLTVGLVEVPTGKWNSWIILSATIEAGASSACA